MALQEEFESQGNFLFKYRGHLPIIIFAIGAVVLYFTRSESLTFLTQDQDNLLDYSAFAVSILGLFIRAYTVGRAAPNTSGRNTTEGQVADDVNTTGIYSIVRHPLYVGNFFMWLGVAILTQNFWFLVAYVFMYWLYYERIMFAEEQFLRRKFGEKYVAWAAKTPAFIPCFKKWKKNALTFNLKKAIRQEKTGFFLLTVAMYSLNLIVQLAENEAIIYLNEWGFIAIAGIVSYVVIKFLQKATTLLAD